MKQERENLENKKRNRASDKRELTKEREAKEIKLKLLKEKERDMEPESTKRERD